MSKWPFNADGPRNQWTEIDADGFPDPVPGCVYDGHRLDGGAPARRVRHRLLHAGRVNGSYWPLFDIQRHRAAARGLLLNG